MLSYFSQWPILANVDCFIPSYTKKKDVRKKTVSLSLLPFFNLKKFTTSGSH